MTFSVVPYNHKYKGHINILEFLSINCEHWSKLWLSGHALLKEIVSGTVSSQYNQFCSTQHVTSNNAGRNATDVRSTASKKQVRCHDVVVFLLNQGLFYLFATVAHVHHHIYRQTYQSAYVLSFRDITLTLIFSHYMAITLYLGSFPLLL